MGTRGCWIGYVRERITPSNRANVSGLSEGVVLRRLFVVVPEMEQKGTRVRYHRLEHAFK